MASSGRKEEGKTTTRRQIVIRSQVQRANYDVVLYSERLGKKKKKSGACRTPVSVSRIGLLPLHKGVSGG